MTDDVDLGADRRSAVARLRDVSPALYRGVIVALGLAGALSLYRTLSSNASYTELLTFALVLVVLLSAVVVLERLFRSETGRLVTASAVLIAAGLTYSLGLVREEISGPSAVTVDAQPTVCLLLGLLCRAPAVDVAVAGVENVPDGPSIGGATGRVTLPVDGAVPTAPSDPGLAPPGETGTVVMDGPNQRADEPVAEEPAMPIPEGPNRVWIQFAGNLDRETQIVPLATGLEAGGWTIPSAKAGGERIAAAAGRAEIRYFYDGDRANAARLAEAVRRSALPEGLTDRLSLVPLDASRYPGVREGTLELWLGT